jgi:hypothetical protein
MVDGGRFNSYLPGSNLTFHAVGVGLPGNLVPGPFFALPGVLVGLPDKYGRF